MVSGMILGLVASLVLLPVAAGAQEAEVEITAPSPEPVAPLELVLPGQPPEISHSREGDFRSDDVRTRHDPAFIAPFTRTVQTGQYVQPGATLATLVRRDPLLLRFQVPEQEAAPLRPGLRASFEVRDDERQFTALLTHVAESADPASRMVAVTAQIDDPAREALRPGTFAQISIPVGAAAQAPVIPQIAVRPSERGFLSYVVEGGVARERVLVLGMRTADGQVEVRSGVRPGDSLVVHGAEALYEGAPVRVASNAEAKP